MRKKKSDIQKKKELIENDIVLSSDAYKSIEKNVRKIIGWFREGLTDQEILLNILRENPKLKESSAHTYLKAGKASFREEYILERKFNIIQHVRRYDKDILFLSKFEPKTSSYAKYNFEKSQAYLEMINYLQKKERVLGFHKKMTSVKIKNNINVKVEPVKKSYDFSNLTWEEKKELFSIIKEIEINENEKLILSPNKNKLLREENNKIIDVEHEIIDEKANIEKIIEKPEELPSFDINPISKIEENKNVIDLTNNEIKKAKSLDDIKQNLLGNLLK